MTLTTKPTNLSIHPLEREYLEAADRICRTSFGTFLGVPEPEKFFGDADYVHTRFHAPNTRALAVTTTSELAGTNFVTSWGSVGFFGPLSVKVDLWNRGIASALMEATMEVFSEWGTRHAALFTWADSAKHHGLYQKFGFYPTFLTAIMSKPAEAKGSAPLHLLSQRPDGAATTLDACRVVTDAIYPGLDLSGEMRSVTEQGLGDVVLVGEPDDPMGFAICHVGSGTEAGGGTCFVKFGAIRPGPGAADCFGSLVDACEALAAERGAGRLVAGANMGRLGAYKLMISRGFRTELTGVAMQQAGDCGYNRTDVFVIDDWR